MQSTDRARELRKQSTDAEAAMWWVLRNRALDGQKFRRQHPVGPYVADFAYIEAGLIVELDGGHHAAHRARDAARSAYLLAEGFRVIRFWNHEVLQNSDGVAHAISRALTLSQ